MAQLIPGKRNQNFVDTFTKKIDSAAVGKIADYDVFIRGNNVVGFLVEDIDQPDDFQKAPTRWIFHWREEDGPNYRKGDQVTQGSKVFEIKEGYPVSYGGCWLKAHLKTVRGV